MLENKLFRDWSGRVRNSDNRANSAQVQMNLPTRAELGITRIKVILYQQPITNFFDSSNNPVSHFPLRIGLFKLIFQGKNIVWVLFVPWKSLLKCCSLCVSSLNLILSDLFSLTSFRYTFNLKCILYHNQHSKLLIWAKCVRYSWE